MNARKLFLISLAAALSSAAFADEIGSGEFPPTATMTGPAIPATDPEVTSTASTTEDSSLWMRLIDWFD